MKSDMPFHNWDDIVRYSNVAEPAIYVPAPIRPIHRPHTLKQKRSAYYRKAMRKSRAKKKLIEPIHPQLSTVRQRKLY